MEHRRCVVLRGTRASTEAPATALLAGLADQDVLWVGPMGGRANVAPSELPKKLGESWDAVVLDLHDGVDADRIGLAHGLVRGGGALVLRLTEPAPPSPGLDVYPYRPSDVGHAMQDRIDRTWPRSDLTPLSPPPRERDGTPGQAAVIDALERRRGASAPSTTVLIADRGRGKSAALGLALARLPGVDAVVTGEDEASTRELRRFAPGLPHLSPTALLTGDCRPRVLLIDEAARLPVPILKRLSLRHADARLALATTVHGYEGTGRGFVLRFLEWLRQQDRPPLELSLTEPIRWAPGDPLEAEVDRVLALDAEPAPPDDLRGVTVAELVHQRLARGRLAADEPLLREVMGLLVHAHYRTTPADLQRMLDAPNLSVHVLLARGRVVAASLVAEEGGLPRELCAEMAQRGLRLRGHALPDTLASHTRHPEAGELTLLRSVRIATHPALRRLGLGTRLVHEVHASATPDAFGTMFGATPELLRFRRGLGYELVRVGIARGSRTGEPAAVMLRPVSAAAGALVDTLRAELARDLPLQLELLEIDGELPLDPELREALLAGLPPPAPLTDAERDRRVRDLVDGPAPYDAVATAVTAWVRAHPERIERLSAAERGLVEGRVLERRGWVTLDRELGGPGVRSTMRSFRRALRKAWSEA